MASTVTTIDLFSEANEILLNSRWPKQDYETLHLLAEKVPKEMNLTAHVWIATSGSTADSIASTKLVAISKQALKESAVAVNKHLQCTSSDIWAQVLPTFHVGGLGIEIRASLSGSKVVNALAEKKVSEKIKTNQSEQNPKELCWDVNHFYKTVCEEKCTLSALVPAQVYDLISLSLQAPPSLRAVIIGGGAFDVDIYKKARDLGWPVLPSYGMTETSSQIATASLTSLMNKIDFPDLGLLSHAQVEKNEAGFLKVKASSLFTCYAQNTADGVKYWNPKKDGWFTTEDKGNILNGNLIIEGRSRDYIKIGGEGTNVARLRSILENCALVLRPEGTFKLALLDVPSDRLGSEIHLVSLLSEEQTLQIVKLYTEKVLPFEKIRKIHYRNEIPRNELGKILWGELRKLVG